MYREDKKMRALKTELYMKHQCGEYHEDLTECYKNKELCTEQAFIYEYCIRDSMRH